MAALIESLFLLAALFVVCLSHPIHLESAHLKFISDCSPYKDTSCSIRCQLYQCADYTCGLETTENPPCKQNLRVQSFSFIELTDGQIAMSLKYDIPPEELSNLTMIFHRVGSLDETHFVAVFSRMNTSDYPVFLKEVISEFPIPEIQREDEVVVKYSTNVCGSPKMEVLKVPKYLVANQSLVAEYHECPGVKANFPTVLEPVPTTQYYPSIGHTTTLPLLSPKEAHTCYLLLVIGVLICASLCLIGPGLLAVGVAALKKRCSPDVADGASAFGIRRGSLTTNGDSVFEMTSFGDSSRSRADSDSRMDEDV